MNKVNESIIQGIDILIDERLSHLRYDKTIATEILEIKNVDAGEYRVGYQGNQFLAYSEDLNALYKVGDSVFVKVPEGDFSNKKIITGYITSTSLSEIQMTELQNTIVDISPNLSAFYTTDDNFGEMGITAGIAKNSGQLHERDLYTRTSLEQDGLLNPADDRFRLYANEYEYVKIQASFLTSFYQPFTNGNYGIKVEFFTKDVDGNESFVTYILDHSAFNGDPYRLGVYSPQYIVIKVQKNYLRGLKRICLFEEEFEYDIDPSGRYVTSDNNPNIFCKDIEIKYVERRDMTDTSYHLIISPLDGNSFNSQKSRLRLQGQLIYQGQDVLSSKTCDCSWYQRDFTVLPGTMGYDKDVGFGWRKIENEVTGQLILTLDKFTNKYQQKYKLKVVYNSKVVTTAEIDIFNLNNSQEQYQIYQETTSDDIELGLLPKKMELSATWYYSYPDGSYFVYDGGNKHSFILVKNLLLYSAVTFYCLVYDSQGNPVCNLEHTIFNTESEEDLIVEYDGQDNYKYDANGDIPYEDTERDRTLTVYLKWREGIGTSYKIEWLMRRADGEDPDPIPIKYEERFDPQTSMIQKIWLDKPNNILHYNIKQKFNSSYNNNYIIIRITTLDGKIYELEKEILFLKDGDQGTNGTTYIAAVRPYWIDSNQNVQKQSGFQALRYNNGWISDDSSLKSLFCFVYKDGIQINNTPEYTINYTWTGINVTINGEKKIEGSGYSFAIGQIAGDSYSEDSSYYVIVQIDITEESSQKQYTIYTYYPIDVIYGGSILPSTVEMNIPSYIKYSASGVIPKTYRDEVYFNYQNQKYTTIKSKNKNVLDIKNNVLAPAPSFTFEDTSVGVLKCNVDNDNYIIHSVIMYLDTYGNEAINGWDGTKLEIDPENKEWLFAPQIGAGEKDEANRFTGVVMGKDSARANDKESIGGQGKTGLYGYRKGINTFGLMDTGKAFFGAPGAGGRIIIDGQTAAIYGGDSSVDPRTGAITRARDGMILFLADTNNEHKIFDDVETEEQVDEDGNVIQVVKNIVKSDTVAISIGLADENVYQRKQHGVFEVNYNGDIVAHSATINGHLYAQDGRIGGSDKDGDNDGWIIETNKLYSGEKDGHVALYSGKEEKYLCPTTYHEEPVYERVIVGYAQLGMENIPLYKDVQTGTKMVPDKEEYYRIWAGGEDPTSYKTPFRVTSSGVVYMSEADITGSIYAKEGRIGCTTQFDDEGNFIRTGGWLIEPDQISSRGDGEDDDSHGAVFLNSGINSRNGQRALGTDRTYGDSSVGDRGYYRIWAGNSDAKKAPFAVTSNGFMYADNAIINGKIYAEEGRLGRQIERDDKGQPIYDENGDQKSISRGWIIKGDTITSDAGTVEKQKIIVGYDHVFAGIDEKIVGYTQEIVRYDREPYIVLKEEELEDGSIIWNWTTEYREVPVYEDVPIIETQEIYNDIPIEEEIVIKSRDYVSLYNDSKSVYITVNKQTGSIDHPIGELKTEEGQPKKDEVDPGEEDKTNNKYANLGYVRFSAGHSSVDDPVGNAKFLVTSKGYAYMEGAYIDGKINSEEGQIGGWTLDKYTLHSSDGYGGDGRTTGISSKGNIAIWVRGKVITNTTGAELKKDDEKDTSPLDVEDNDIDNYKYRENMKEQGGYANGYFYVTRQGKLYCRGANIGGVVNADRGYIGAWKINDNGISSGENGTGVYINASGMAYFGDGFRIGEDGEITATAGKIGGWKIDSGDLAGKRIRLISSSSFVGKGGNKSESGAIIIGADSVDPGETVYGALYIAPGGASEDDRTNVFNIWTGNNNMELTANVLNLVGNVQISSSSEFHVFAPADSQSGIYASFAPG